MATIRDLAQRVGLSYEGDGALEVKRVRGLLTAGADDLSFVASANFLRQALGSPVRALIAPPGMELAGKTVIRSPFPQLTLVQLTPVLHPPPPRPLPGIHPRAIIGQNCSIAPSASIGPNAVLGDRVTIGERTTIGANTAIADGVSIGDDCEIHANVSIYHECRIGQRALIHSGAVIGARGFGLLQHEGRHVYVPHIGNVVIGDDVEIGANTCVDRATYESTIIRDGTKLDNLVHVGHNVTLGEHTILASQVGMAGSTTTGKYFLVGGQSGINGHLDIPDRVTVAPRSGMTRPGKSGVTYAGYPARPFREWTRAVAAINLLPRLLPRLREVLGAEAVQGPEEE
jgi:UDP-3-O-[3-hydroxymyristoyl] glucosamine N-acyltransferase